jgi:integrase
MYAARPSLELFLRLYTDARPDMRPASRGLLKNAASLVELWAGREVFVDEFSRDYLLAFRAWRVAGRELPIYPRTDCAMAAQPLRRLRGTHWRCPAASCPHRARFVLTVAAPTANRDVRLLLALWNDAIDRGYNAHQKQRIKPLAEELDNLPCLDPDEVAAVLASCAAETDLFMPVPAPDFWAALILAVYDCGSRISALMETVPADLDFSSGTITLRAKNTKQRGCQVIGLSDQTLDALRKIYDRERDYLFPWPYDRSQPGWSALGRRLKRILKRAQLPYGNKHLWHKFRRTTATWIAAALGIEAAREHLGHSSVEVTKRYIDRTKLDATKRNARVLPRPI